jgi:membrane fusion protein, multidrug efflux system
MTGFKIGPEIGIDFFEKRRLRVSRKTLDITALRMTCWVSTLGLLLIVNAGCTEKKSPQPSLQAAQVTAETLTPVNVPLEPSFIADVQSSHQVDIVARVSGFLERIAYREGSQVDKGEILFEIDPKPLAAQLASEKAQLERSRAEHWIAKVNLDRIRPLAEKNAASKSDLDAAVGRLRTAEASMAQAQARVDKAVLDLSYTTIRSPIRGIAGEALAREGAFLTAGTTDARLTTVTRMDPAWVEFSVTQNQFLKMRGEVSRGSVVSPQIAAYEIEVELSDGQSYPQTGRFDFAEPTFNPKTGTFQVRVELPNPQGVLVPGMAVRAKVKGAFRPEAIVVPQKAVQQTANGHIVYIVNAKNEAEIRPVVVGEWVGQNWVIDQGLQAGERLIVDGFQRLAPGVPVVARSHMSSSEPAAPVESK